jgi:exodeoxyribonuclease V alpha subunit
MRIKLLRGIATVAGWIAENCATRIQRAKVAELPQHQPEQQKPPANKESVQTHKQALHQERNCPPPAPSIAGARPKLGAGRTSPEEFLSTRKEEQDSRQARIIDTDLPLAKITAAEEAIAKGLAHVGRRTQAINPLRFNQYLESSASHLSDEQRDAIRLMINSPVSILTGAPGSGKTATVKMLLGVIEEFGYRVRLAAPTGRAAQRLREVTGHPAETLHRMLSPDRLKAYSGPDGILPIADVVIVDEASMVDLFLMERLVKICSPSMRLILIGDINQLPSIGIGQVLFDLIGSSVIPVIELQKNFRQASGSRIIAAAEAIKEGQVPDLPAPGQDKSDCYFIEANDESEIERLVINAATRSLPARCGADPYQDIQVLTPKHKGLLGTLSLNKQIQLALHDRESEPSSIAHPFLPGDRVLNTKNDYQLDVFNGQCGRVLKTTDEKVTIKFEEREVEYSRFLLQQLIHGYAMSIHRSQGSEYPFVIIPVHENQYPMLNRELLYTALTRGQKMVVLVGSRHALQMAVENTVKGKRHSGLKEKLIKVMLRQANAFAA